MFDHLNRSEQPTPGRLRAAHVLAALGGVFVPAMAIAILAGVWVRSSWIDEKIEFERDVTTLDRKMTRAVRGGCKLELEFARGVFGMSVSNSRWTFSQLPPEMFDSFAERQKKDGWKFRHVNTAEEPTIPGHPYRPFDRDRKTVGWSQSLQWSFNKYSHQPGMVGGFIDVVSGRLVAPCWFWMLPWLLPPLWWWWCPTGRIIPRLTLRRAMVATAIVAAILAAPAALYRSAAEDRALTALGELQGHWEYGPDPAGSGRTVVIKVSILSLLEDPPEPYPGCLAAVLRSFPTLQILHFSESQQVVSAEGFIPIIEDHPGLKELDLPPQADDRSMAAIGRCRELRELRLNGTKITGAGLVHLAHHPNLEKISLDYTQITKSSLDSLHGLPKLKSVHLRFKKTPVLGGVVLQDNSIWLNKSGLKEHGNFSQDPEIDDAIRRLAVSLPSLEP